MPSAPLAPRGRNALSGPARLWPGSATPSRTGRPGPRPPRPAARCPPCCASSAPTRRRGCSGTPTSWPPATCMSCWTASHCRLPRPARKNSARSSENAENGKERDPPPSGLGVAPRSWSLRVAASRSVLWPRTSWRTSRGEVRRTNGLVAETASRVGFTARTKAWRPPGWCAGGTVTIPDRPPDGARCLACGPGGSGSGSSGDGNHDCGHRRLDRLADRLGCPVALGDLLRPCPKLSLGQAIVPGADDLAHAPDPVHRGDQRGGPGVRRHLLHQRLGSSAGAPPPPGWHRLARVLLICQIHLV